MSDEKRKSKKRIYISGPMTGFEDFNRCTFKLFEHAIKRCEGWAVVNPAAIDVADSAGGILLEHDEYLELDMMVLGHCDAIFMMPGWENSKGAVLEYKKAKELELEVYGFVSA